MIQFSTGNYGLVDLVGLLVAVVIPILVDLVTKRLADPRFKAIILAALSAANGFLMELLQASSKELPFQVDQAAMNAVTSFIIAVALFYGLWKPAGVSGSTGAVQGKLPGGFGHTTPRLNRGHDRSAERGDATLHALGIAGVIIGLFLLILGLLTAEISWIVGLVVILVGGLLVVLARS